MNKFFTLIKTHVWQSILIAVAACGVISAAIAVPVVLLNQKPQEQKEEEDIPDVDPEDQKTHATKVTPDPNAPFYLKVGETRLVNVSFDQTPTDSKEKTFTWKSGDNNIAKLNKSKDEYKITEEMLTPEDTKGRYCAITGVSEGKATITATNDYNKSIVGYFYPNVIKFSERNNYLWQYESEDRKQFGYDSKEAKAGTPEGVAVLGGKEWSYTRSETTSLQSAHGAVGFGKGSEPETHVHLESENSRIIKKIVIEAASHKALAQMTVKVGDTTIISQKCPDVYYDQIQSVTSEDNLALEGKISIDFETPAYDASRSEDPTYIKPGACYIKSILIYYVDEEISGLELDPNYTPKLDYFKGDTFDTSDLKLILKTVRGTIFPIDVEKAELEQRIKLSKQTFDTAKHETQDLTITYTDDETAVEFPLTVQVHVRDEQWEPESIFVEGSLSKASYLAGDDVDYSELRIGVIYDTATNDIMYCPFEDYSYFIFTYNGEEDPFIAMEVMQEEFTINIDGQFAVDIDGEDGTKTYKYIKNTTFVVPAGTFTVAPSVFDRIDFRKSYTLKELKNLGLNGTASPLDYTVKNGHGVFHFDAIKKDSKLVAPQTNKFFTYSLTDTNYVVDKLNLQMKTASTKINDYSLLTSVFGGNIYGDSVATLDNNKIIYIAPTDDINALKFIPGKTSTGSDKTTGMMLISIIIRFKEGTHVAYTLDKGDTAPDKMEYVEGETFNPAGLKVNLVSEYGEGGTKIDVTDQITWYDGSTYETKKQSTLLPESTYVVGEFNNKTIKVDITKVESQIINLTLVKDMSEITEDGKYYLVNPSAKLICLGSAKSLNSGKGSAEPGAMEITTTTFGDTASLNILQKNDYFSIKKVAGTETYTIVGTNKHAWSVTKGGSTSSTPEPEDGLNAFTISINAETGYADIVIKGTTGTGVAVDKFLGATDAKFDLYDTNGKTSGDKHNVQIYKVA